jgi:hypothetical protein
LARLPATLRRRARWGFFGLAGLQAEVEAGVRALVPDRFEALVDLLFELLLCAANAVGAGFG